MKKYLSHSYRKYLTLGVFSLISLTIGTLYVMASGGPLGYVYCSGEDSVCVLGGSTRVAYGADGQFEYRTLAAGTASIPCDNATFGDPIYGVVKACYRETVLARILLPWKNNGTDVEEKQPNGYLVTAGSNKEITVNYTTPSVLSECKKITATTKNVFVPTANQSEWNNFKTNAPNNNLGVTIGNCGTSTVVGYGWNVGTWGACNAECGTQTNQYRTVTCNEMTSLSPKVYGNIVSDAYCSSMTKPLDVQGCTGTNNCAVCNINGIQDNGETGVDCGGPYCSACSTVPPTSTISGPVSQCVSFGPSTYYKINYYTQTNPQSGYIQDQTYNVAGIGNASFQGYVGGDARWAQPVSPMTAYTTSSCTPVSAPINSCASPDPSFANIGTLTRNPTSPNQGWTYSTSGGSCSYTCTDGWSGTDCGTAPVVSVNGACGSADGQSSGNNPLTNGGNLCAAGTAAGGSSDPMTGTATWQCNGSNGGTNRSCSAKYSVTGWCSAAEGQTYAILPPQLCYRGAVISGPDGGYMRETDSNSYPVNWSWSCGGLNGGSSIPCEAIYAPITSGGGDGGGDGGGCGGAGGSCGGE